MESPGRNFQIDYIEFGATNIEELKRFYNTILGWQFTDYGPTYTSFHDGQLGGGFTTDIPPGGNPLVVIYTDDLEAIFRQIKESEGTIVKDIFSFPGGRRFHFQDPSGNELAVWSE
ncbi:VOC family protein [Fodinibius salsisoli]|uniref:VOC family protein n=1 Tax=Fodinibius salsisoli TaxID=2820877 RepID=A0ABT3PHL3_9BACT|nr:VOC family protein [Fodinibius salsisoli]MCW9705410.1 VOC family protein [Fodinibius salsisoli]